MRFARLAADHRDIVFRCCVDSRTHVDTLAEACQAHDVAIGVVAEIEVGQRRCGVRPQDAVDLVRYVRDRGLRFDGIQCYQGLNQHIRSYRERGDAVMRVVEIARAVRSAIEAAGIQCQLVTGGGTGTFEFEAGSGVFTEVQPGSYLFLDVDYAKNMDANGTLDRRFVNSLFVMTTVISVDADRRWAVVDAGTKAVSLDSGPPTIDSPDAADLSYRSGGDEHGIIYGPEGQLRDAIEIGSVLRLVPGHCDPTVNLYDEFLVVDDDDNVLETYAIAARGPGR
ncbi:D-serine dehydratase-like domain-containing protein [Plasmodiophora brassicae]